MSSRDDDFAVPYVVLLCLPRGKGVHFVRKTFWIRPGESAVSRAQQAWGQYVVRIAYFVDACINPELVNP